MVGRCVRMVPLVLSGEPMELQQVELSDHQVELSDHGDGYVLFQRAIVEGNEDAWATLYDRYRSLLVSWARHYTTMPLIGEYYDDIADQAFARAWAALSPARFSEFASVAKLLAYLRTCVVAVAI